MAKLRKYLLTRRRNKHPDLTLMDLPNEMLTEVFSYLNTEDLLESSKVCKRFNEISKAPLLWGKKVILLRNEYQIKSFCRFFRHVHDLQKLTFYRSLRKNINFESEGRHLYDLFKSTQNLRCLKTNFPLSSNMIFASLRHLSLVVCQDKDVIHQFSFLADSPHLVLEYLSLTQQRNVDSAQYDCAITSLLEKCKFSLRSLSIQFKDISEQVMTSIVKCQNLKELKLSFGRYGDRSSKVSKQYDNLMCNLSELPELEVLQVTNFQCAVRFLNLPKDGFRKLKDLRLCAKQNMESTDYDAIIGGIPNLNTFLVDFVFRFTLSNYLSHFLKFVKNHTKLINVGIGCHLSNGDVSSLTEILELQNLRNIRSVCVCKLVSAVQLCAYSIREIKHHTTCSVGLCLTTFYDIGDCPC